MKLPSIHGIKIGLIAFLFISSFSGHTQIQIDPPHWWTGFPQDTLQLFIRGKDIAEGIVSIEYAGIEMLKQKRLMSNNYLIVLMKILPGCEPGNVPIKIRLGSRIETISYSLKARNYNFSPGGLGQEDFIYLLMPDRFANGNEKNDEKDEFHQSKVNRDSAFYRHGGDLEGIHNHLDYLKNLGVTALWLNPFEENNQYHESYHGYAITNHYAVDARLGTLESYKALVKECHKHGIKMIRDVVYNHFGSEHYLIKDLPDSSWINKWDTYTRSNFRATTLMDPYASEYDQQRFSSGWFDHHMADMNYENKDLALYMIQNSIWWVEEMELDAYRIDTYTYPNPLFMMDWAKALKKHYPSLFLFAETWVHGSTIQAWFAGGNKFNQGETNLDGVTDFQMYYAINNALSNDFSWTKGVAEIYYTLVDDILYKAPENMVLFLDNHDLDRFYGVQKQDFNRFKVGVGLMMTMRGIPSILYGTEILMPYTGNHGIIRTDFPGGWKEDPINKFNANSRSDLEQEAFEYIKHLADWRKTNAAITQGKLKQFVPEEGVYVFFRYTTSDMVMVVINQNKEPYSLSLSRFREMLHGKTTLSDVLHKKSYKISPSLVFDPMAIRIFEVY